MLLLALLLALVAAAAATAAATAVLAARGRARERRAAEELALALPEVCGAGAALLDEDRRLRRVGARFRALVGEPEEALCGRPAGEWLPELPEREAPGPADGEPGPAAGGAAARDAEGPAVERLDDRELELLTTRGGRTAVRALRLRVRARPGDPPLRVLVVQDRSEAHALRQRVVSSGRLAAVGELAAAFAHEINNPLAYVHSNLGVLRALLEELAEKDEGPARRELEEGRELVEDSLEGADRIALVVRDLQSLSGPSAQARELVDVNALLEAAIRLLQPHLRFGARVERRLSDVPRVRGSAAELQHVFLALLLNAGHALGAHGTLEIVSRSEDREVVVEIADDGCGIPAALQPHVFEPFVRGGDAGDAGGLGLPISRQVVRGHGGRISLASEPGAGTRVTLRLPVAP